MPRVLSIQSHVVHGYVGNRCATFCLQRLGIEVDTINTVQLSNHTLYPSFTGSVISGKEVQKLYEGLDANRLTGYSHVLTGYMGTREVLEGVHQVVKRARIRNAELVYVCDPVMGDNGRAYLPEEMVEIYRSEVVPLANVLLPNQFEAELLTGMKIEDIATAAEACRAIHDMGPQTVILTSMDSRQTDCITLYASTTTPQASGHLNRFTIQIPKLDQIFTGTGDLLSALVLALLVERPTELDWVCEQAISRLYTLLQHTLNNKDPAQDLVELDLIHSQHCLLQSSSQFPAMACNHS